MRAGARCILLAVTLLTAGCKLLEGYVFESNHFRFGTAHELETSWSLDHALKNLKFTLKEHDIGITKVVPTEDAYQVWASKSGLKLVFDLTRVGPSATLVHAEVDQSGNYGMLKSILGDMALLPDGKD